VLPYRNSGNVLVGSVPPSRDMSVHTIGTVQVDSIGCYRIGAQGTYKWTSCLHPETCLFTLLVCLYPETCLFTLSVCLHPETCLFTLSVLRKWTCLHPETCVFALSVLRKWKILGATVPGLRECASGHRASIQRHVCSHYRYCASGQRCVHPEP
jgi:hypothetical protein